MLCAEQCGKEEEERWRGGGCEGRRVTLQSFFNNPIDTLTLTSGVVSASSPIVTVTLSTQDAVALKRNAFLCARQGTCYLTIDTIAISDMSGNAVIAIPDGEGVIVQQYITDSMSPMLQEFDLDVNSGLLTLSFNEIVDTRLFMPNGLVIRSSDSAGALFYRLTGGERISSLFSDVVVISLTSTDLNGIKATSFAKERANTYLTIEPSTITDLSPAFNPVQRATLQVNMYGQDLVTPQLIRYHLDLSNNVLLLTFTEPMNEQDLRVNLISLHSAAMGGTTYQLTGGTVTSSNQRTIVRVAFSSEDLLAFKYGRTLATSVSDTFISIGTNAISDTSGIDLAAISRLPATSPNQFTPDTTRMALVDFTLDIFNGLLILTFDDVANASTFDPTGIVIQDAPLRGTNPLLQLSPDSTTSSTDSLILVVQLTVSDRFALAQASGLATRVENTYLRIQSTTVQSIDGQNVVAITDGNALRAGQFIGGGNGSELQSFTLNMNTGELVMTFNLQVDALSFTPELVIFHDFSGTSNVSLTGGIPSGAMGGRQVTIQLTTNDINALKAQESVATSVSNTYLSLEVGSFADSLGGNAITPEPVQASSVIADIVQPELQNFDLDLNLGQLRLTFSETVLANSITASGATIQSNSDRTMSAHIRQLTGGRTVSGNGVQITFQLNSEDLNALKADINFATSVSDTYLTVTSSFARDAFGNRIVAINPSAAVMATLVSPDSSPPTLDAFTLDLDSASLILTFSEIVDFDSVMLGLFTLQSSATSTTFSQTLSNSARTTTVDSNIITVSIRPGDLYPLQQNENLGTNLDNTFISVGSNAARDTAPTSNVLTPIFSGNALQARNVVPDTTSPMLTSFSLDTSDGSLLLTFNEVVNISTFSLEEIVFQNAPFFPNSSAIFSDESTAVGNNAAVVRINLSRDDFDKIQTSTDMGTDITNSYLNLTYGAVADMSGNPNVAVHEAVQANNIFPDTSTPILLSFEVNMNFGTLILSYSEAINAETFDVTGVTLYNTSALMPAFQLTSASEIISPSGNTITINLNGDINPLREAMVFGSDINNTYVTIAMNTAFDFAGNPATDISSPMQPNILIPDTTGPILSMYELDLNTANCKFKNDCKQHCKDIPYQFSALAYDRYP